jgi:hypothetical protein
MKYNFVEQYVTLSNPFLSDYPHSEVVYDSFEAYDARKNAKFVKLQRKTK